MLKVHEEFADLVRATRDFIAQDRPIPPPPKQVALPKPQPEPKPEPEPIKPVVEPKPLPKPATKWPLNPMPLPDERLPLFTEHYSPLALDIPIRLIVTEASDQLFLENIARALTAAVAPATLYSGKIDALLTQASVQLVLAPLSFLKKRFPEVELHQFWRLGAHTLLPMAETYDTDLKRDLWTKLKNFPNTPPSS